MTNYRRRSVAALILCAVLLFSSCGSISAYIDSSVSKRLEAANPEITEPDFIDYSVNRVYYKALSENEKLAYRCVYNSVLSHPEKIELPLVTEEEVTNIFTALRYDNPFLLCLTGTYKIYSSGHKNYFLPEYRLSPDECAALSERLLENAAAVCNIACETENQFERELYIHDFLCKTCVYSEKGDYCENAVGPILGGKAVCSGYAYAGKLLFDMAGIESFIVTGEAKGDSGDAEKHMWLAVNIENNWYHLDITWDAPTADSLNSSDIKHTYFNLSTEKIKLTHYGFTLPGDVVCDSDDADYYRRTGLYCSEDDWYKIISRTLESVVINGDGMAEFRFSDSSLMHFASDRLFNVGGIYYILRDATAYKGTAADFTVSYSYNNELNVLRINLSPER